MGPKTLLVIAGPTGIGKTAMAIGLAQRFRTEILSADSRQFYREMRIGTAVPTEKELQAAPHHFIQHLSIHEEYSVGDYEKDALQRLDSLFLKHDVVVMAGGSGLYIDAVLFGFDNFPEIDPDFRLELIRDLEQHGLPALQTELKTKDPSYAARADLQNPQRVIRALEVCRATGKPYSSFLGKKKPKRPFSYIILGLEASRAELYRRIEERVDRMVTDGLLEEARKLMPFRHLNALQTLGYRELFDHFEGKTDIHQAVSEIKKNSRRYAKRQGTWFRRHKDILLIPHDSFEEEVFARVSKKLKEISHG
jgi:tRNA dimethylallyltransferase